MNLAKEAGDVYNVNYKTLLKEIKDINKWKLFKDWKTWYYENDSTPQSDLLFQCNPY